MVGHEGLAFRDPDAPPDGDILALHLVAWVADFGENVRPVIFM
jgi:hypothetical protein